MPPPHDAFLSLAETFSRQRLVSKWWTFKIKLARKPVKSDKGKRRRVIFADGFKVRHADESHACVKRVVGGEVRKEECAVHGARFPGCI